VKNYKRRVQVSKGLCCISFRRKKLLFFKKNSRLRFFGLKVFEGKFNVFSFSLSSTFELANILLLCQKEEARTFVKKMSFFGSKT
jgi:hypothetical protein